MFAGLWVADGFNGLREQNGLMLHALLANGHALGNGTLNLSRLLVNTSFSLPLNAAGNGGSGPFGNLTL